MQELPLEDNCPDRFVEQRKEEILRHIAHLQSRAFLFSHLDDLSSVYAFYYAHAQLLVPKMSARLLGQMDSFEKAGSVQMLEDEIQRIMKLDLLVAAAFLDGVIVKGPLKDIWKTIPIQDGEEEILGLPDLQYEEQITLQAATAAYQSLLQCEQSNTLDTIE